MNPATDLTPEERTELSQLETSIQRNLRAFYEVGHSLMLIRDKSLYKETHATFEAYCKDKWDFTSRRAYQLIDSAHAIINMEGLEHTPSNEAQVRPLTKLEPEMQKKAWEKAIETAPEGKVTASHVKKTVDDLVEEIKPPKADIEPEDNFVEPAIVEPEEPEEMSPTFERAYNEMMEAIREEKEQDWENMSKKLAIKKVQSLIDAIMIG